MRCSEFSHVASDPARPTRSARFLLWCIRKQAARQQKKNADQPPAIPLSPDDQLRVREAFLARLRKVTDSPSFIPCLSSLQVRRVISLKVPGANGMLRARLYIPHGRVRGAVLFLHGGGFVHCGLTSHHGICCRLARSSGAAVLMPEYRLAPEHPFPAAVEDVQAVLRWLAEQSRHYWGGDVAVAGDSAGGNLAAVLAQQAKKGGLPRPVLQLLYYPTLYGDDISRSHEHYGEGHFLSQYALRWYGAQYLAHKENWTDLRFAPGFAQDLTGLAPAVIMTAQCDPLRDDGARYAQALRAAGVPVAYACYSGSLHGFLNFYAVMPPGKRALRAGGKMLRRAFAGALREQGGIHPETPGQT